MFLNTSQLSWCFPLPPNVYRQQGGAAHDTMTCDDEGVEAKEALGLLLWTTRKTEWPSNIDPYKVAMNSPLTLVTCHQMSNATSHGEACTCMFSCSAPCMHVRQSASKPCPPVSILLCLHASSCTEEATMALSKPGTRHVDDRT